MKKADLSLFYTRTIAVLSILAVFGISERFMSHAGADLGPVVQSASTPKPNAQAISDLKKEIPLDPSKLGDPLPKNLWVELSKLINPTVVSITTTTLPRRGQRYRDPLQEFLEDFWGGRGGPPGMGGGMQMRQAQPVQALGTGFIIRDDGLIITNNHVIEQADVIKVQLDDSDDKLYEAEVVGRDARTDIALIKINAKKKLPAARLGTSKNLQVGEWVAAFGNPYGHAHTMTVGIVSALGRAIEELNRYPFIQTDASINPGNSGGPLVNTEGFVVGVNTAVDARAQGIGFAIPIDNVTKIIGTLEKEGHIHHGYIGIGIAPIDENTARELGMSEPHGVLVSQVLPAGPAGKGGVHPYDIIVEVNGKKTDSPGDLQNEISDADTGSTAKLKVWRYDQSGKRREMNLDVKVADNPEETKPVTQPKKYFGQKAPFDLGFKVSDWSEALSQEFGLTPSGAHSPIITDVDRGSPAEEIGLQPGDLVVDVNRTTATKATDVIKLLKKGRNILRLIRGDAFMVVTIGK